MKPFKIKITRYKENGSLTDDLEVQYADNVEEAERICRMYEKERYTTTNENGETVAGLKMYKVELCLLCYKTTDKTAFFKQYEA